MKKHALRATLWSAGDLLARQGIQFATILVLARFLSPEDFGVVAMTALFVAVANVLADGGLSIALVQRQHTDHEMETSVFWFNVAVGVVLAVALATAAPLIADFYRDPRLIAITRAMSLAILFSAAGGIHFSMLTKKLNFRDQALAGGTGAIVSGVTSVLMAINGLGVWAIVSHAILMPAVTTATLWSISPWRPSASFHPKKFALLFNFGGNHLVATLLEAAYSRLYTLFIGRMFGPRELGYYSNAELSRVVPSHFIGNLVSRVALPLLSREATDPARVRRGIELGVRLTMVINAPAMLGLAAVAGPFVEVFFGHQWLPAAPILQILCIAAVLYPVHALNVQALLAQGHANIMLRLEVAKKMLGVALLFFGVLWGVLGVAWSQVALSFIALAINTHYSQRHFGFGAFSQLREIGPLLLAAGFMAFLVHAASDSLELSAVIKLLVLAPSGALFYLLLLIAFRSNALSDAMRLLDGNSQTGKPE